MNGADLTSAVVIVHVGAAWFMAGLIWFVQAVHYPMMRDVGPDAFARYERVHQQRTTWVVAPAMLIEAVTGVVLVVWHPRDAMVLAAGGLLVVAWVSTAFVQVPCHRALEGGFDARAHRHLVASNWVRTIAWTARGVIVGVWVSRAGVIG